MSNPMIKVDTETCGFVGPIVLIQYQIDDGPVILHHVWNEPVYKTLDLIERFMDGSIVIFNMTFDSFQLSKCYNTFRLLKDSKAQPEINEVWNAEHNAWDGLCLRPKRAYDLFILLKECGLHFLQRRKPISVRKAPIQAVSTLLPMLEDIPLHPLLFAGFKDKRQKWDVKPSKDKKEFVDFIMKFSPSMRLKRVCNWLFGFDVLDFDLPQPSEQTWKPFGGGWRNHITNHIRYWEDKGVGYATQDILLLQLLIEWFKGKVSNAAMQPSIIYNFDEVNVNSELAWQIGVSRQRGYAVDIDAINEELSKPDIRAPINTNSPDACKKYLLDAASPEEKFIIHGSDADTLEALAKLDNVELANRAKLITAKRERDKVIEILRRLKRVGRFYPDFKVIGTLSNRMAGSGGINPQGIQRDEYIRKLFLFQDKGLPNLSGGDFKGQEVAIIAKALKSDKLINLLKSGTNFHTLVATYLFDVEYDDVTPEQKYAAKNKFVFPFFYGAQLESIAHDLQMPIEEVQKSYDRLVKDYPEVEVRRSQLQQDYCSMVQPGGLGSKVYWNEPKVYSESVFGERRYFEIETLMCKTFFNLAENPPELPKGSCVRTNRIQSIQGATRSAFFAAAFNMQAKNLRQAGNNEIQSTGAKCTKLLQLNIWNLQPTGINPWRVQPFNVHDEVMAPNNCPEEVSQVVEETMNELRKTIDLLELEWKVGINNWSEKG